MNVPAWISAKITALSPLLSSLSTNPGPANKASATYTIDIKSMIDTVESRKKLKLLGIFMSSVERSLFPKNFPIHPLEA